jgi:hypothetical protein
LACINNWLLIINDAQSAIFIVKIILIKPIQLKIFTAFLLILLSLKSPGQYDIPEKMEWWYGARFGMLIHFGSYSYLGHGEWAFYTEGWNKANYHSDVSSHFNPANFNAETIVSLAKNAGMKYLVITAKHHEGFSM